MDDVLRAMGVMGIAMSLTIALSLKMISHRDAQSKRPPTTGEVATTPEIWSVDASEERHRVFVTTAECAVVGVVLHCHGEER